MHSRQSLCSEEWLERHAGAIILPYAQGQLQRGRQFLTIWMMEGVIDNKVDEYQHDNRKGRINEVATFPVLFPYNHSFFLNRDKPLAKLLAQPATCIFCGFAWPKTGIAKADQETPTGYEGNGGCESDGQDVKHI
jgi:hypothetical protein